jgi:hypothetical protein
MLHNDVLVEAIFDAINQQECSPEEKRIALARAGLVATAYEFRAELLFPLKHDRDVDDGLDSSDNSATTQ